MIHFTGQSICMSMYRPMRSEYQIDMHGPLDPLPVISGAAHKKEGLGHLMRSLLYIRPHYSLV